MLQRLRNLVYERVQRRISQSIRNDLEASLSIVNSEGKEIFDEDLKVVLNTTGECDALLYCTYTPAELVDDFMFYSRRLFDGWQAYDFLKQVVSGEFTRKFEPFPVMKMFNPLTISPLIMHAKTRGTTLIRWREFTPYKKFRYDGFIIDKSTQPQEGH
ncbi:MAG: hypothetical protein ACE5ES_00970 [Candidatus Nanoarchaeia archaeon]